MNAKQFSIVVGLVIYCCAALADTSSFDIVQGKCKKLWSVEGTSSGSLGYATVSLNGGRQVAAAIATSDQKSKLVIFSANDSKPIREIPFDQDIERFISLGDIDGTGEEAIAVTLVQRIGGGGGGGSSGSSGSGKLQRTLVVLSPKTARTLWKTTGGVGDEGFAASIAKFSFKDKPALLLGWTTGVDQANAGKVQVISATSGSLLGTIEKIQGATWDFGGNVYSTGDLDGDGQGDLLVADPAGPLEKSFAGRIYAISSRDFSVLWTVDGEVVGGDNPDFLGDSLAAIGDVDGDGIVDIAIGVHNHLVKPIGSGIVTGQVRVVSGKTGKEIWRVDGSRDNEGFGLSVLGISDIDGDGIPDLLVGAPNPDFPSFLFGEGGRFSILSGKTGKFLVDAIGTVKPDEPSDLLGSSFATILDGKTFAVTTPRANKGQGRISALSCIP